jgi:hypothetical protein
MTLLSAGGIHYPLEKLGSNDRAINHPLPAPGTLLGALSYCFPIQGCPLGIDHPLQKQRLLLLIYYLFIIIIIIIINIYKEYICTYSAPPPAFPDGLKQSSVALGEASETP